MAEGIDILVQNDAPELAKEQWRACGIEGMSPHWRKKLDPMMEAIAYNDHCYPKMKNTRQSIKTAMLCSIVASIPPLAWEAYQAPPPLHQTIIREY